MVNIRKATNKEKESRVGRLIQGEDSFVESAARSAAFTLCPKERKGPRVPPFASWRSLAQVSLTDQSVYLPERKHQHMLSLLVYQQECQKLGQRGQGPSALQ